VYRPKYFSQCHENTKRRRAGKQCEGESEQGGQRQSRQARTQPHNSIGKPLGKGIKNGFISNTN